MDQILIKVKSAISRSPALAKLFGGRAKEARTAPSVCLVCDYGKAKIVFAEIEKSSQGLKLIKFNKTVRSLAAGKDAEVLQDFYLKGNYSTQKVRVSLKGQGVIIRFVQFPQMKESDLRSAISFEIDQYIPFKAPEVVWDFCILEENVPLANGGAGMNVLLTAVKREDLYSMVQLFQTAGLQIELIDVDALASINALEYCHPEDFKESVAILDIGAEVSTLSVVHNGKPRFIRDMTYGGMDILKRLKRKLSLTQEQALQQIEIDKEPSPEAAAVIKEALSDLLSDLRVSLNYYLDQVPGAEPVKKLFLEGGGGYHPLVIETLSKSLGYPVETMRIAEKLQTGEGISLEVIQKNQGLLPIALGLCLR